MNTKKLSIPEAKRILAKVPTTQGFWLCTAQDIRSLSELSKSLSQLDDDAFRYHVNRTKNDFEIWIRTVIEDKDLGREIARVKTKETLHRKVSERVKLLSNTVKQSKKTIVTSRKSAKPKKKVIKATITKKKKTQAKPTKKKITVKRTVSRKPKVARKISAKKRAPRSLLKRAVAITRKVKRRIKKR